MAAAVSTRLLPARTTETPTYTDEVDLSIQVTDIPVSQPTQAGMGLQSEAIQETTGSEDSNLLISSPYTEKSHRLRLSDLDKQSALLAQALQVLDPLTPDYALSPYTEALNWNVVLKKLRDLCERDNHEWSSQTFFVVAFFSRLKPDIDRDLLGKLDKDSHEEAAISGGLLKYWFGSPSPDRRNLATCLWRSEEDAIAGGAGPGHARAMRSAKILYERIDFKTMSFTIEDGAQAFQTEVQAKKTFDYAAAS